MKSIDFRNIDQSVLDRKIKERTKNGRSPIELAPMLGITDRYFRTLALLLFPKIQLYTEMIHSRAILERGRNLSTVAFSNYELPLAIQIAGDNQEDLFRAAQYADHWGFDEVNINTGCPSKRATKDGFGAILQKNAEIVYKTINRITHSLSVICSLKTRLGLEEYSYQDLFKFIKECRENGLKKVIIHARIAKLRATVRQNHQTQPKYEEVYRIKQDFPDLDVVINGSISTLSEVKEHLFHCDRVMIGRAVSRNPRFLDELRSYFSAEDGRTKTTEILSNYFALLRRERLLETSSLHQIVKPILNLFHWKKNSKTWRKFLASPSLFKEDRVFDKFIQLASEIET